MKELTKFLTFFICLSSTFSCTNNDDTMEKESIYQTIETLDNWYSNGLIKKRFQPTETWTFFSKNSESFPFSRTNEGFRKYLSKKLEELQGLNILSESYKNELSIRFNSDTSIVNEGILFTNHPYGDCLTEFLVTRESMDYLVTESPEYNSFQEDNVDMSDENFKEWQKNRISLLNANKAEFKVMYSEVGYQDIDRAFNFVIIMLVKENDSWKINNISIQETTPDEMMNFYNAQVELRGYYN